MKKTTTQFYTAKIKAPYELRLSSGAFHLYKGRRLIHRLRAQSANGADREAAIFLGV